MIRTLKTHAHLKMYVFFVIFVYRYRFKIGTLVVVYKRAVIKSQSLVRLIVAKDVVPNGMAPW